MAQIDSNCIIFDKFIQDDLLPYTLLDNTDNLIIKYNDNTTFTVTLALNKLARFKPTNPDPDIWYPVWITDDIDVNNKVLSQNGAYKNSNSALSSGRLGIEDFISFAPKFKNLSISAGKMSIDWILNQSTIPFFLSYGLLG